MATSLFVAGTDTGVGKTHVALKLIQQARRQGLSAAGYKPVASGCDLIDDSWRNSDAIALQSASSIEMDYSLVNPYAFAPPIAPHIAASEQNIAIDINLLCDNYRRIQDQVDVVIVEGAGGCLVPINENLTMLDLAQKLELPICLVVGLRLGCINHALLSVEAIRARGIALESLVFNQFQSEFLNYTSDIIATIKRLSKCNNTFVVDFEQE